MKNHKFNVDAIAPVLSEFNVVGGWLFGSAVSGVVAAQSDIDIAVLFRDKPGLDELAECRLLLQNTLCFDDIDLVVINDASVILRFAALMGRRVLCADEALCAEFASLTAREYEDEMAQCYRALHFPSLTNTTL